MLPLAWLVCYHYGWAAVLLLRHKTQVSSATATTVEGAHMGLSADTRLVATAKLHTLHLPAPEASCGLMTPLYVYCSAIVDAVSSMTGLVAPAGQIVVVLNGCK